MKKNTEYVCVCKGCRSLNAVSERASKASGNEPPMTKHNKTSFAHDEAATMATHFPSTTEEPRDAMCSHNTVTVPSIATP